MRSFSIGEIAKLEGVGESVVRQWIRAGELRAYNASGSKQSRKPRLRIEEAALIEFRRERSTGTAPEQKPRRTRSADIPQYV